MVQTLPARSRRVPVVVAVAALLALIGMAVVYVTATRALERSSSAQMRLMCRVVQSHISGQVEHLDEDLKDLDQYLTDRTSGREEEFLVASARVRGHHPRLIRTLVVCDENGDVVLSDPADLWRGGMADSDRRTITRCLRAEAPVSGTPNTLEDGSRVLMVALPGTLPARTSQSRRLVLAALLDCAELTRMFRESVSLPNGAIAFLSTSTGAMLGWAGDEAIKPPATIDDVLPALDASALRQLVRTGRELERETQVTWANAATPALLRGERLAVGGDYWVVGVVWPAGLASSDVRPLTLLGVLLLSVIVAGIAATGVAWVRLDRDRGGALETADRWRRAAETNERERRWRSVVDETHEPVAYVTQELKIERLNAVALESFGAHASDDVAGRGLLELVAPEERQRVERFLLGRFKNEQVPDRFQTRLLALSGERKVIDVATSLTDEPTQPLVRLTWRDLTGRERAEALLRAVAAAVPTSIAFCTTRGELVWANEAFGRATKQLVDRFHGRPLLPLVERSDWRSVKSLLARARKGKSAEGRVRLRSADDRVLLGTVKAVPVTVAGAVFGVLFSGTELHEAESRASSAEQVQRARVLTFLWNDLAHRLNNGLQSLVGLVEQLRGNDQTAEVAGTIRGVLGASADQLRRVIVASRSGTSSLRPLRLKSLVERWRARVEGDLPSRMRLLVRHDGTADRVLADEAQLGVLLDALLSASLVVLGEGGGAIEVGIEATGEAGRVRLAVSDTGGVEEEAGTAAEGRQQPLFSPRELALALAELVAERHDGRAGSKQRAGVGKRIWIDLPVWAEDVVPRHPARPAPRPGVVLIADDEPLVRTSLAEALRERGREVVEAGNGAEVVDAVVKQPARFSLLVLDLVMPVMDGREALRRVREIAPDLPVLLCTGYEPTGDEVMSSADMLIKPFSLEAFIAQVDEMLGVAEVPRNEGGSIGT